MPLLLILLQSYWLGHSAAIQVPLLLTLLQSYWLGHSAAIQVPLLLILLQSYWLGHSAAIQLPLLLILLQSYWLGHSVAIQVPLLLTLLQSYWLADSAAYMCHSFSYSYINSTQPLICSDSVVLQTNGEISPHLLPSLCDCLYTTQVKLCVRLSLFTPYCHNCIHASSLYLYSISSL